MSTLTFSEVSNFLKKLNKHNQKFSLQPIEKYKLYMGPLKENHRLFIRKYLTLTRFKFLATAFVGWGLNSKTLSLFNDAVRKNVPFFLIEDGFIRSIYTWCADIDSKSKSGISFVVDSSGFYFDSHVSSDLENLLNTYKVSPEEIEFSKQMVEKIVSNKISKYNNQPLDVSLPTSPAKKKVLIIDQSYGDMSLIRGGITDEIFKTMVSDAINENPDAEIFFKVHPDNLAKKKQSGFIDSISKEVKLLDCYANPITLLEQVDKVYVATSQMGFEALLCGKDVYVYGLPFYAGWGLTHDKISSSRRTKNLNLYELFYVAYVVYSHYIDPVNNTSCGIDRAIDYIIESRKNN